MRYQTGLGREFRGWLRKPSLLIWSRRDGDCVYVSTSRSGLRFLQT